jgi:hypothetical protein
MLSEICERYYYILYIYFFVLYIFFLFFVSCGFVILTCVAGGCLDKTLYWFGYIAVLCMHGDYEYSVWLVPLFKKGIGVCAAVCYGVHEKFQIWSCMCHSYCHVYE